MARKIALRVIRVAAPEDESVQALDGPSGLGSNEPQQETEKVTIPEGGEVHLQNSNILPDSLAVTELKTDREFTASEDQSFGPGKFFFMAEEGTVFFDPSDAGTRVKIEYLWKEDTAESAEDSSEEEDESGDDGDEEVLGDEEEKSPRAKASPSDSLWHLDQEWFKWKPLSKKLSVNNSLQAKLEKGVDIRRGLTVKNEKTGKEIKVLLSGQDKSGNLKRQPGPGQVAYNYDNGTLYWGDPAASGNTYVVEYFLKGQKGTPVTMEGEENEEKEYNLVESFKSRAENLWTHLLDNPNPEFVRDTLIPVIEDEIESARDKILSMDSEPKKEEALKNFPDLTGEFMELEQLLAKREEEDNEDNRRLVRDFIESDIAPKLSRFYSLASLLAERVYDMQSDASKDEDFPEFGSSGARAVDLDTLKYLKKVRQEANGLDQDLVDFSKFYTGLLLSWITDPTTYYPTAAPRKKNKQKADPRWEAIKRVFEQAGVGLADLQAVALEAFRRAVLEFDRDRRNKEKIPDPKKFRIFANPLIHRRVTNALKRMFDKYQMEQTVESTTRSGSTTVTIPDEGGEVDIKVPGFRVEDLQVKGSDGKTFTSASGVMLATQPEARKSPRVKILLGKGLDKDAQVSLTVPETGEKLSIIRSKDHPWNADLKKKVAEDPSLFYFAHSSGTLWLSDKYRNRNLLVEAPGLGSEGAIGKDQYRAHPTRGTLEFSPLNGGDEVEVSYSQTIRAKRYVNPVVKTDDDSEATSLIDMKEDEGADPLAQAEDAVSQENVDNLLNVIGDILTVDEDPRLTDEDRAILQGLLGLGEAGGQRLTIQEIAAREPFNIDVTDSGKLNQLKTKRQKAANMLLEILREKATETPALRKMVRPFEAILLGKGSSGGAVENDKFLGYLKQAEDKARPFQNVLVGVIGKAGLKQDEENILRWMWALPGDLRRDDDAEDKTHQVLPDGLAPAESPGARLQEIAIDEFGIEADDDGNISPAATGVVNKVYERALAKFSGKFNEIYESRKDFFTSKYPEFVQYYDKQLGKQTLRDELTKIDHDEYVAPPEAVKRPKEEPKPLFEEIKRSLKGVDEGMLRSLMEELLDTHKSGGKISELIAQREEDLDTLTSKGATMLESRTEAIRAQVDELKVAADQARGELEAIEENLKEALSEREKLREQAVAENEEVANKKKQVQAVGKILGLLTAGETSDLFQLLNPKRIEAIEDPVEKDVYETYSYLRNAGKDDLEEAQSDITQELDEHKEELKELRKKAVELAADDVRKGLRKLKQKVEELTSKKDKFRDLLAKQEAALDSKRDELKTKLVPLQKKLEEHLRNHNTTKELDALQKVHNFLSDRDDLQRSDGSFALDNMFELPKAEKGPGYKAPKLAPGEEDTYQPAPRSEVEPGARIEPKPSGLPEPSTGVQPLKDKDSKAPAAKPVSEEAVEQSKTKFAPRTKEAPTETQRSLFDELRSVAVSIDPDETKKAYQTRLENFRTLMNALRKHFADGKSIKEFKPQFPASKTMPDQNKALRAVLQYLLDFGADLKQAPGVWDLSGLFSPTITRPVNDLQKKVDMSSEESAIESLANAQPSLTHKGHAKSLHEMMRLINKGTSLKQIIKGLKASGNPNADTTLSLAQRLAHFMALHEDLKKDDNTWDFQSLYSGAHKFPSYEEFDRSKPVLEQIGPLVKSIQTSLREEAGAEGGIESVSSTEERVRDMLDRMSELALHGMDLEQMGAHFEKEDKRGAKSYSLAYLFQQTRNFLKRLNQTKGLANSRNDMGLADLFGPGAPAGTPTESDEVEAPTPAAQSELLPSDDRTTAFRNMAKVMGMDEKEAGIAHQLVSALQLRMEDGNKIAAELIRALLQRNPKFQPTVMKLLAFIGKNRTEFESGIPGVPNLSSLTGMPFKHPSLETSAPEAETPASEGVPAIQEILKEKVEPASESDRKSLRKSIFEDFATEYELDADQRNLFADGIRALKDNGGKSGIEKLVAKTKDTQVAGVFELLVEFFREKGLVGSDGVPDFRGVSVPALEGRESFFAKDGTPNLGKVEEEAPEFDADDISADMPEPRADVEEQTDELVDELGGDKSFSPDMQEAVDFLKSDHVVTDTDGAKPRDTVKERLKKNIWNMMVQEFDFDAEEQQTAAEILESIQKKGLSKIKAMLKGNGHAEVLLDDLVDFIKEQGLSEEDIAEIKLPEIKATDAAEDDLGMSIEELMGDAPQKPSANRLTPTVRKEVDEETMRQVLTSAQKAEGKGLIANLFDVPDLIRGLEGKVLPEDAKNALLQAMDQGLVELRPESGRNTLSEEEAHFVPVAADGVPLSSGKVIRIPEPKAAPAPAAKSDEAGTRGRLPASLVDRASGPKIFTFVAKHSGLTSDEIAVLNKEVSGADTQTYRQLAATLKKQEISKAAQNALQKYLRGFTAYLRIVQQGNDPVEGKTPAPAPVARPKGEWRSDPATEKQLAKIQEVANGLKELGADLPPVSLSPTNKGDAADAINALKAALEEAQKAPKPAPATPAAPQTKSAPASPEKKVETLRGLLSKDSTNKRRLQRLRSLLELGAYSPEEMRKAISLLEIADADKQKLLAALPQAAAEGAPAPAAPKPATPPAPAATKSAPAPAPASRDERSQLQRLMEKALDWSSKNEVASAQGFRLFLKKNRPELVPAYEKVMPAVQKALDAIHSESLDFDLSDL